MKNVCEWCKEKEVIDKYKFQDYRLCSEDCRRYLIADIFFNFETYEDKDD